MSPNPNWKGNLRPELELILCCAHTRLSETKAERIREILHGPLSWSNVLATALENHVEPFLYENLKLAGNDVVPAAWLEILRESTRKTGRMAMLFFSELLRICEIFEAEQVPLIPFKGPILGWLAYHSLTRRRSLDLDFFTPQENIPRATALLKRIGFEANFGQMEERAEHTGHVPGQYAFSCEAARTQVELHTEWTLRYFPVPLNFKKMSGRLITVELAGRKVRTFSIEDTLVMLSVHGAKHFWDRLSWLLDIEGLTTGQPVDWPLAMRIAAKLKSTRLLLLGLYLAHDLMDAPLPKSILLQAQQDSNVQWLARKVERELADGMTWQMGILPRAAFRYRSRDAAGDALRHMVRLATTPTEKDRESVPLPSALAPFYAFVRPWKLVRDYGIGLQRSPRLDLAGFQPMRPDVVERMLKFAAVGPGDVLYDLGCGDGRIVVAAAEKFGIRAVGVDIDPRRIAQAKANARKHGVQRRVEFLLDDAKRIDLSEATLVTLYLEIRGILRLADTLKQQLRPGTRVVSCDSVIYGWPWDEREQLESAKGELSNFYLWRIGESPRDDAGAGAAAEIDQELG